LARCLRQRPTGPVSDSKKLPGLDLEWNPAACAFPFTEEDVAAMKDSIAAKGQIVPGKAWTNPQTGKIEGYDGRIRQAACRELRKPFQFEVVDLPDSTGGMRRNRRVQRDAAAPL